MPTVLIVAANPIDQDRLRLNAEVRDIRHALQRSRNREEWKIESNEAATVDDLRRALLDLRPTVLHFSGHGGEQAGLLFENAQGNSHSADAEPLAKLLHHFKDHLKCVVLNACYSSNQGEVIRQEIDYVIGMKSTVEDNPARSFAVAFYDGIFAGTDFRTAFDLACTSLDLNSLPDSDAPVFMTSPHLNGPVLTYSAIVPEIERVLYAYCNTHFEDRCTFTTTGEKLRPIMKKHYGERFHRSVSKVQVLALDRIGDEHWKTEIKAISSDGADTLIYYLRICDRTIQIEWEASVGLWSVPAKVFLALGPKEPVIARVTAELDTYYNREFRDKEHQFQSVKLSAPDLYTFLHGYVERGTKVYDALMRIISDGNRHAITLELLHINSSTEIPMINRVLSDSWLYSPE